MPTGAANGLVLTSDGLGNGTWQAPAGGGGDITAVNAGTGLTGGGGSGDVTLDFDTAFGDGRYSLLGHNHLGFHATLGINTYTGTQTISSGNLALPDTVDADNGVILIGGNRFAHRFGTNNTFLGDGAGNFIVTGTQNTAVGNSALLAVSTGHSNTAVGASALWTNNGSSNTAIGSGALLNNSTGSNNTAIGNTTLLANRTGGNNTAVGNGALHGINGPSADVGSENAAVGHFALNQNTTGTKNTGLGTNAGYTSNPANANTTGSLNTFIGYDSGPGTPTQLTNATAIGTSAVVSQDNSLVLGSINGVNGAAASVNVGIGTATPTTASDVVGTVRATAFVGDGALVTSLDAGNVSSGTLGVARGGTGVTTAQGNGTKIQLSTGSTTTDNCVKFDASGNTVDAGAPCGGGGGGSGTVTSLSEGTGIDLTPDTITAAGTVAIDTTTVPRKNVSNTFTEGQAVSTGTGVAVPESIGGTASIQATHTATTDLHYGLFGQSDSTLGTGVMGGLVPQLGLHGACWDKVTAPRGSPFMDWPLVGLVVTVFTLRAMLT